MYTIGRNSGGKSLSKTSIFLIVIFLLCACSPVVQEPTATLTPTKSPIQYADETLPGAEPERFGEDFFNGSFHSAPVFLPDGTSMWWAGEYSTATIFTSRLESGTWTSPAIVKLADSIDSYRDPFISPDGTKFYFISTEPYTGSAVGSDENIWMMEKQDEEWGEPQPLPESINSLELHWTFSVADNYDLYFAAQVERNWDVFLSRYVDGAYTDPVRLDPSISSADREFTPNIAPDGSYLLFSRMPKSTDIPSLFISYRVDTGWSDPVKVENIPYCLSPIVTPDQKYVIFLSSPSTFAWRDTAFIEENRPQ